MKNNRRDRPTKNSAWIFLFGLAVVTTSRFASPVLAFGDDFEAFVRAWRAHVFAVFERISFHDDFESGNLNSWQFPYPEDWAILSEKRAQQGSENGAQGVNHYLHMKRNREPGMPRRPLQFALLKKAKVGSFDFQARVRREGKSMIVVFNYVDTLHFYYAHLSADRGQQDAVHNGIFIVNGEPRKRIAGIDAPPALPDREWRRVRVARNARAGTIQVFMDDAHEPLFSAVDDTFTCGQVGIGSFDETGDFDDVVLISDDAGCQPGATLRPAKHGN